MNRRLRIVCLGVICAFGISALVAQSASASTTAYTCVKGGEKDFAAGDSHCKNKVGVGTGEYGHVPITKRTKATGVNSLTGAEVPIWKLKAVIAGVTVEVQATGLAATGEFENATLAGEMYVIGEGGAAFTGVTVTAPAGKGCVVRSKSGGTLGTVLTQNLTADTFAIGGAVKFEPVAGEELAVFFVEGCSIGALNGIYELNGVATSTSITGSTVNFTHAKTTEENKLTLRGQKAGIDGTLTVKGASGAGVAAT